MILNIHGEQLTPVKEGSFLPIWGFICCHTEKRQGARSFNNMTEYNYCLSMLNRTSFIYSTRDGEGLEGASMVLSANGVNCSIEPHFNAFDKTVEGMELLVLENDLLSIKYAKKIVELFAEYFPERKIRNEGLKFIKLGDRGYSNLSITKKAGLEVAILSELFFGDNERDFMKITEQAEFWKHAIKEINQETKEG